MIFHQAATGRGAGSMIEVRVCREAADYERAMDITRRYADWLGIDLCFQNFDQELASFPRMYGPPRGVFLLAYSGAELAGGVGLRPLPDGACEMKRLFVFDDFRGLGAGRILCDELIRHARELGYGEMKLDTLDRLREARGLYTDLGFREIEAYCFNPEPGVIFMALDLVDDAA